MTTTRTYRLAPAPKLAGQYEWSCHRCDHETLLHPVFLDDGTGPLSYGTHCAAVLLGLIPETGTRSAAEKALRLARKEQQAADQLARQEAAKIEHDRWAAWLTEHAGPGHMTDQFTRLGGFAAASAAYHDQYGHRAPYTQAPASMFVD